MIGNLSVSAPSGVRARMNGIVENASLAGTPNTKILEGLKTPETSRLFEYWTNPRNGVKSFILAKRVAPVQQTFYYTHPSFSDDGRYLWLGCGYPPPGGRRSQQVLGVVDFEVDEMRVYPETQFSSSRPTIDPSTGEAYWCNYLDVWRRGPLAEDKAVLVNRFPEELVAGRLVQLATHPTFSPSGCSLNLDARFEKPDGTVVSILGEMPLDGSPFRLWWRFERKTHNHALFNPVDPNLQMCAHEFWMDHEGFDETRKYHRMWLLRRGAEPQPVLTEPVSHSGHEWWDPDGKHVWYVHYGVGIKKVDLATRTESMKWPGALSHGHADRSGRWLVADRMDSPTVPDCHVLFRDTVTGREVEIVNRPPLAADVTQCLHLHPHPQFCLHDRYICHTTTIHDRVDVALVPVEELKEKTR